MHVSQCPPQPANKQDWGSITRGVLDLRHTLVTTALAQQDTGGRRVGKNVTTDGLTAIGTGEEGGRSRVRLDLVGHENTHVELYGALVSVWLDRMEVYEYIPSAI
jgi:hypothetical protein